MNPWAKRRVGEGYPINPSVKKRVGKVYVNPSAEKRAGQFT